MRRLTLDYLRTEAGAGLVLPAAALAAIGLANSGYAGRYWSVLAAPIPVQVGPFAETFTVAGWVRALLMPTFFLVVGMELKFELFRGELSNPRRLALPLLAAIGGLVAPALVFLAIDGSALRSPGPWTASLASDGAVALAALAIAGQRVGEAVRALLVVVAAVDNLVAAVLAAGLGAGALRPTMALLALATLAALWLLGRWRRAPFIFYAAGFVLVWAFALEAGLDPALAGVACAFTVPLGARRPGQDSALRFFLESLHPYVAFAVLPLFVLTAAGAPFAALRPSALGGAAPLALILALAVGKPLGVFGFGLAGVALKWARRPAGAALEELIGAALLTGVGLSVSYYFVGADASPAFRAAALVGSALAALAGGAVLALTERPVPRAAY